MEIQVFGINGLTTFRQQQVRQDNCRTLETVGEIVYFRNELEAVENIGRCGYYFGKIPESRTEHLPQVSLLGFGGHTRGRTGALNVYYNDWRFDHRRHAEAFGHQSESAARRRAHRTHTGVSCAYRHVDYSDLIFNLTDHDLGFARVCSHPM